MIDEIGTELTAVPVDVMFFLPIALGPKSKPRPINSRQILEVKGRIVARLCILDVMRGQPPDISCRGCESHWSSSPIQKASFVRLRTATSFKIAATGLRSIETAPL